MKKVVVYLIEGKEYRSPPFEEHRVKEQADDICSYEGVTFVRYEEVAEQEPAHADATIVGA